MNKTAFLFPGQGAQYVGMGKELYENYREAKLIFDRASEILKQDMARLCFEGGEEDLKKTENTQPAILTVSIAAMEVLVSQGIKPDISAGLSLGEYGALVTSGALAFEDALPLVRKRGILMQQAVPMGKGTMAAIIGLNKDTILDCISKASQFGVVEIANYNCPGQIVISGETEAIEEACKICKENGARRAMLLPVSAPFHSSMLKPAGEGLKWELDNVNLYNPSIPVISNVEAKEVGDPIHIKDLLVKQVSHSVRFQESIEYMIRQGTCNFVEVGPGKALTGFLKKISKHINIYNVEDKKTLENTINGLEANK